MHSIHFIVIPLALLSVSKCGFSDSLLAPRCHSAEGGPVHGADIEDIIRATTLYTANGDCKMTLVLILKYPLQKNQDSNSLR